MNETKEIFLPSLLFCAGLLSGCAATPTIDESSRQDALAGNSQSQYELGLKYYDARYGLFGKDEHWEEAARWFAMAAEQGDVRAQYYLSLYYFNDRNDYEQAFRMALSAATNGIAEAQYFLGMLYAQAWGTSQDLVEAYKWIQLANDAGIKGGSLADVDWLIWKGKLTPDQIAEGRLRAREHTLEYGIAQPIQPR